MSNLHPAASTRTTADAGHEVVLYTADLVIPITAPPLLNGAIAVRDGRILHVGEREWVRRSLADRGIGAREIHWPGVLMPGLVNAHSHLQYTGMAEVGRGQYAGFDDWSTAFNPVYDQPHDWAADAAAGAQLMIEAGTTAVADIVTDGEASAALHDAGLHGITYWEVMSWTNDDWARTGRQQVEAALDALPSPPGTGLSPHAPYSLEVVPLLEIPDIVRERGSRLHLHLGEAAFEREFHHEQGDPWHGRELGSFRELRAAGFGTGATEYVDQLGVLGPDCHIAHGIYMTARDRALLRARGTSVALCPRSNAVIGLDEPPVAAYLAEGNALAIGTDSLSSSPSLDLMADVAELSRIAHSQGHTMRDLPERLLRAATLGGAHAMGIDVGPDRTGHLAVGALADLAFFEFPVTGIEDTIAAFVESGTGRAAATLVSGRVRFASTTFTTQTGVTAHD
ncbi:amidohydrolase family protein [Salinibacterium sp. NK8237]|uniref:amidohydrolase family protein n=1 Tax=Salinibacterium sp. NK8237 TaxID=2792038 RepID=UPI0018CD811E|nr:amidohydrolase family protein [Salinibacterium sp. NK8237]MBH0130985.1 amidohydrolase family protein [Salinibacterium sp. NK8237]